MNIYSMFFSIIIYVYIFSYIFDILFFYWFIMYFIRKCICNTFKIYFSNVCSSFFSAKATNSIIFYFFL